MKITKLIEMLLIAKDSGIEEVEDLHKIIKIVKDKKE